MACYMASITYNWGGNSSKYDISIIRATFMPRLIEYLLGQYIVTTGGI